MHFNESVQKDSVVLFITLSSTDNFMCSSSVNCVNDSVQFIKKKSILDFEPRNVFLEKCVLFIYPVTFLLNQSNLRFTPKGLAIISYSVFDSLRIKHVWKRRFELRTSRTDSVRFAMKSFHDSLKRSDSTERFLNESDMASRRGLGSRRNLTPALGSLKE